MNLKEALKDRLTEKEFEIFPRAFDVLGSIAIIDIPDELKKKEKMIAQELMKMNKNIKTVFKKADKFKGRLRTRKLKFLAGINTKETEYRENNCVFRFNIETSYFSPRLSSDRLEIANKVKKGERVLVLFSGVAPYPIVIAKNSEADEIWAVELNTKAAKYARENVLLNKVADKVHLIQGDVKKKVPELKRTMSFDRIVMARPQLKNDFLKDVSKIAKKGTFIHFYDFLFEEEIPHVALKKIESVFKNYRLMEWRKCGDIGPRKYRIRVDFQVR